MKAVNPKIESSWLNVLKEEFEKPYFIDLKERLIAERNSHTVYPPGPQIFSAFDHTPFNKVKVVIIGQDPYHGPGQANGLCFSVKPGMTLPPSLKNIFKELESDLGFPPSTNGDLTKWADQGVLLINSVLTVRAGNAASHKNWGWENFTDAAIQKISDQKEGIVFLLWGNYAKNKGRLIDASKHHILSAPHPSPFSVHTGFYGCKHFSKTNAHLESLGKEPINWDLNK